ncbi:MAG: DinB family protein [Chitinophagaceae bacterium]
MMTRSQLDPMPQYFDRYINKCDDIELLQAIQRSIDELDDFPLEKWKSLGNKVYAPGKWTVTDILQHLVDTERIFAYRALAFSRGETQALPSFNEDEYASMARADTRTVESLVEELRIVHQSFQKLFESFTPRMLQKSGKGFKGEYSVASIGFCMPGHQRWHINILEQKYYPLLTLQTTDLHNS